MMAKRLFIICAFLTTAVVVCLFLLQDDRASGPILSLEKVISKPDDSTQWFKIQRTKKVKGVALVVHGLNLNPARMHSIIIELNDSGIDVLNLALRGHGNNYLKNPNLSISEARLESFQSVTYSLWMTEVYHAYLKVKDRASRKNVPVFFVGYSLGGLMGCDLILAYPDVSYDRMVLFAPAFSIMMESYLLKALMPFPNMVIDSLSPLYYRTNNGTPISAYKALFEAIDHFNKNVNDKLNKPALIFIDEKDEFVPFPKLNDMITKMNFEHWRIYLVRKDDNVGADVSHHLMIDRESVGGERWKQIKEAVRKHFDTGT